MSFAGNGRWHSTPATASLARMDPYTRLLILMYKYVRRPPSRTVVTIWAVVLVVGGSLALYEWFFGWPEALTVNRMPRSPLRAAP